MREIIDKILTNVKKEIEEKHQAALAFSPDVYDFIFDRAKGNIEQGGGGVGNVIETVLINPLARKLWEIQPVTGKKLEVKRIFEKEGESSGIFEVEVR
jgi:ATP-dependent Clp protease ATP-binding subunit ClpA